ncbi:glycerate kinase [Naumannella halotolerans]|uniref:Glycerate kinase n=1 Tax=Naumannella halotolerans TaxID=993414 RepID=A0A4R7J5V2_9ACTN|nr:glycerate kinase [Naumannella halotolerans]TDT32741.1 glycerate kinase [Naumannella halotolerans]
MRVLVVSGTVGALSADDSAQAIAAGWREADPAAQLAAVPMAGAGLGFDRALADLLGPGVELSVAAVADDSAAPVITVLRTAQTAVVTATPASGEEVWCPGASSEPIGRAIRAVIEDDRPQRLILAITPGAAHDAGAGLLRGLGALADGELGAGTTALAEIDRIDLRRVRPLLDGLELILVVPTAERDPHLLGLRGLSAQRGRAAGMDPAAILAADAAIERFAAALTAAGGVPEAASAAGSGACGFAYSLLALGAEPTTGPEAIRRLAGLEQSLRQSDLVVVGCDSLDFASRGGEVLAAATAWAGDLLIPVLVIADTVQIGNREMRALGVEAAHAVRPSAPALGNAQPGELGAVDLQRLARRVARSWRG